MASSGPVGLEANMGHLGGTNGRTASGPTGKPKKLIIKPLKLKPQLPENFEAVTWAKLQEAVDAVFTKRPVACSLEELYRAVEDMCIHKMAGRLYDNLQQECDGHIGAVVRALQASVQLDPVAFLDRLHAAWEDYCQQMLLIRSICLYLDRTYVITTLGVRSLFDMGLQLLRKHLVQHQTVVARTEEGLLRLIERERQGEAVDRALLKSLLRMLGHLGLYMDHFQQPFLQQSERFYRQEGVRYLSDCDVPDYLRHCEVRLSEEYERCQQYLDASTRKPLILVVERQLISDHISTVLDKGFVQLMDGYRREDLARLYVLCGRVSAWGALGAAVKQYIRASCDVLVKDEEKDKDMVERLLAFKSKLDDLMANAFQSNDMFAKVLKESFEHLINQRQNKPAELIAKFIDAKLRSGNKGQTDDELEALLDKALMLFRYISGKDVFEAFYKKDLAKRLLMSKSASIEAEKSMIAKLKSECGSQFTSKLEGMFTDMDLSKDIMVTFRQQHQQLSGGVDMSVQVLTHGFWPTYPVTEAILPPEVGTSQETFRQFYLAKQSGRQLMWHNTLGTCVLRANFERGQKELIVSLFQAVVLCLFNDVDALTFEEIKQQSGIEHKELQRTLQSLACGKVRVLGKEPKGRDVNAGDVFTYATDFSDNHFRIKINSIQLKETPEENLKTNEAVFQERLHQIDAAVVRIMKARKSLSFKLLMSEVFAQLKFDLHANDLKRRIESLIEREFMARDPSDPNVFVYMA